jgi:hypothetical protein
MKPLAILLIAAVLATAVGVGGSTLRDFFQPPPPDAASMGTVLGVDVAGPQVVARAQELKNTIVVDTIIGAATGLILALAAGWIAGGRAIAAGIVGLLGGAAAGAAGGYLASFINNLDQFPEGLSVARTPIVHATLWSLIGAALAVAVGLATRRRNTLAVLGRLALYAVLASAIYPMIASLAFPLLNSDKPIPEGLANTAIWIALPTIAFAIGIHQANRQPAAAPGSTPAPAAA